MKIYRVYNEVNENYIKFNAKMFKENPNLSTLEIFERFINKACGTTGKVLSLNIQPEWIALHRSKKQNVLFNFILVIEYTIEGKDISKHQNSIKEGDFKFLSFNKIK